MWSSREVNYNSDGNVIADIRDYANLHFELLNNHTLPGNLAQVDESISTGLASAFASDRTHGSGIEDAAPNPIAYERKVDIYNLGSYDIDRSSSLPGIATVRLDGANGLGANFDTSGWFYFNGSNSWGVGARLSFSTDMFDSSFGGISFMFPIILDLDNNGVSIEPRTESGVFFNADNDIALERTAWVGAGDGLLAVDLDGDGKINKANEIAFASRTDDPNDTDLEALGTLYDSNGDHQINSADTKWNELRVWVDSNRNGATENGELTTLAARGITAISVVSDHNSFSLPDASRINGFGTFTMNGATRTLADAAIAFQTSGFTRTTDADGFRYSSDDNATSRYYVDMKIAYNGDNYAAIPGDPNALGFSSGALSTFPNIEWDGVLGSQRVDQLVFAAAHPMTLYGDAGNDTLETNGSQNDVLDGGPGVDILKSGGGDDTIFLDSADSIIDGGAGYDTGILTSSGNYSIVLGLKNLEAFISNNGNDVITGNANAAGYIDGRAGNDAITGGNLGDMLVGGLGDDTIYGGAGNDLVTGGAGNDKLFGDDGDDVLIGGIGADRIDGGNGDDTATFTGAKADFTLKRFQGTVYVYAANGESDHVTNVEHLRFDDQTIDPGSIAELPNIDPVEYLASYADLTADYRSVAPQSRAAAGLNHYREFGIDENRASTFDGLAYIASYSDLITDPNLPKTEEGGANHFISSGSLPGEGPRRVIFNPQSYIALNPDLNFGTDYNAATLHYIQVGYYQNRPWNQAPTVSASGTTTGINRTVMVSTLVSASDPEGQALAYYFRDDTVGGGSGRFFLEGNALPEGGDGFGLTAAQFANLQFKSGTAGDHITVHVWDGMASSANAGFNITVVNQAPTLSAGNRTASVNQVFAGPSLMSAADPDGDPLSYYVRDDTVGNGRFWLGATQLAEGQWIPLTTAQFQDLTFKAGMNGSDHITAHVWDGAAASTDVGFDITVVNAAPVVTASDTSASRNKWLYATSLLNASDPNGDSFSYYLRDDTVGGGRFWLDGNQMPEGQEFGLTAGQFANLQFRAGPSVGTDHITVHLWDGGLSSTNVGFNINTINNAPVVTASDSSAARNKTLSAPNLLSASDADGDSFSYYLRDDTVGGGRFWLDGNAMPEGQEFGLTAGQFANLQFKTGSSVVTDHITVHLWDGGLSSTNVGFNINTVNNAPVVTASDSSAARNKTLQASSLLGASDADGDSFAYYLRDDTVGGGRFWLDGNAMPEGQEFGLTAAQFANLQFKTGSSVGSDHITVHLWDGGLSSTNVGFNINTINNAPVLTAYGDLHPSAGQVIQRTSLFNNVSDPDGDDYSIWLRDNTVGGGRFELNGSPLPEGSEFGLTSAQYQQLTFRAGPAGSNDHITGHLWDGNKQSVPDVNFHIIV